MNRCPSLVLFLTYTVIFQARNSQRNELTMELANITASQFIELHKSQLEASGVPRIYWEVLHSKLKNEEFDAGLDFSLMRVEYEGSDELGWKVITTNPDGVSCQETDNIYLIDHAWTYNQSTARKMLSSVEGLLDRMCTLMDIECDSATDEDKTEIVLDKMWQFNQTYSFAGFAQGSDESLPVWYVLDEFGSRIQHSDEPSVKLVPFFYAVNNTAYSIFWPLRDIQVNEEITRDYTPQIPLSEELSRLAHLLPWNPCDFTELDEETEEPPPEYFKMSRFDEIDLSNKREVILPCNRQIKVWSDDSSVLQYLTYDRFKLTEDRHEADIVWQCGHIRDFKELASRDVMVNQFPYESLVTTKDFIAVMAKRAAPNGSVYPRWMPTVYNLNTELPEFLCHYQKRKERGDDNHWIAKPWNLGRGIGHVVTKSISQLVRLPESGPYIAMKYIEDPVLYTRPDIGDVKFDYRYIVLLKSVNPLKISCYRKFFLRFANKYFSLDNLDVYDKHFTVHNYSSPEELLNIDCEQFVPEWDSQYPDHCWDSIETDTMQCIRELFEAASSKGPPYGIPNYPQSRAHYAIDLMLKWDTTPTGKRVMVPQILECNFSPDSARGCKNYPEYFNVVFKALFLDESASRDEDEIVIAS